MKEFTGRRDENNKKIYLNDIVKVNSDFNGVMVGKVIRIGKIYGLELPTKYGLKTHIFEDVKLYNDGKTRFEIVNKYTVLYKIENLFDVVCELDI